MNFRILSTALLIISGSSAYGGVSECYTDTVNWVDKSVGENVSSTDQLKLKNIQPNKFEFELYTEGSAYHSCFVTGLAFSSDRSTYIFRDTKEHWIEHGDFFKGASFKQYGSACELNLSFVGSQVEITASESCQAFCGARAMLEVTLKASKKCRLIED